MKERKKVTGNKKLNPEIKNSRSSDNSAINNNLKYSCYLIVCILPVITAYYYYNVAFSTNQFLSFPLDDPWIHLTFAKNIVEYFSFSYFKNEMVTAGSTSPLYVFIAAFGFLITKNEMILSYFLGILFFALSSFYFYRLALKEFNNEILLSLLVCFVFIFDYWMNFISVSGMETTLFILCLLVGVYLYKSKKPVALGIVLGLLIWTRPDGVALVAAFIVDYLYTRWFVKDKDKLSLFTFKEFFTVLSIFLIFILAYFAMNLYLSGTILSNTYAAKVAFYIDSDTRIKFLTSTIWKFFTAEHYIFLLPGFIIVTLKFIYDISKRRYNQNSIFIFFIFLFIFIYLVKLPMPSRFGRYFTPMIPFYLILSLSGYYFIFNLLNDYLKKSYITKLLTVVTYISILIYSVFTFKSYSQYYAANCKYIYDRQVKTALWIRDNTKDKDIIGTHDIGAIGFYSGRKIADVAGLVNPVLAKHYNDDNYNEIITDYFRLNGVTYTAFMREWFLMLNQNFEFNTPDEQATEAFYVNKFNSDKSRVLPRKINDLLSESSKFIVESNGAKTISSIDKILKIEPDFALAYFYKAYGYYFLNDMTKFEENVQKAIELFPDFKDALIESGKISVGKGNFEDAKVKFQRVLVLEPNNKTALANLYSLNDTLKTLKIK